ncbi:MAG: hypothetical protein R2848_16010 [Thermomicrobiales bacterium]
MRSTVRFPSIRSSHAIGYATQGVPLTVKNAYFYDMVYRAGNLTEMTKAVFMPDGRPPFAGRSSVSPNGGHLRAVAREQGIVLPWRSGERDRRVDSGPGWHHRYS